MLIETHLLMIIGQPIEFDALALLLKLSYAECMFKIFTLGCK